MRTFSFEAKSGNAPHAVLKALVQECEFRPATTREKLAMRFLYPLENPYHVSADEVSMSDGAEFVDQIRFFLAERGRRHFRLLAEQIVDRLGPTRVIVTKGHLLDEGSVDFFRTIGQSGIPIEIVISSDALPQPATSITYRESREETETWSAMRYSGPLRNADRVKLRRAAEAHLNVGDAWTSVPLCIRLLKDAPDQKLNFMTGMGLLLLGRTLEAETYYRRWRNDGPRCKARADYTLAMLYVRHHPEHLRSLEVAEQLLEEAYSILEQLPEGDSQVTFEQVFNRNGLALIEYKRGLVDEAAKRVVEGINRLVSENPRQALHRVVLIYNVALCYQTLNRWQEARETFAELLDFDPLMPEYHLELARVDIALGNPQSALMSIENALGIDSYIGEAHSLQGYVLGELGRADDALASYRRAFYLDQGSPNTTYDLAYALNEMELRDEAGRVLETHLRQAGESSLSADGWALYAEIATYTSGLNRARFLILEGMKLHPKSTDLAENLALLDAAITKREKEDE